MPAVVMPPAARASGMSGTDSTALIPKVTRWVFPTRSWKLKTRVLFAPEAKTRFVMVAVVAATPGVGGFAAAGASGSRCELSSWRGVKATESKMDRFKRNVPPKKSPSTSSALSARLRTRTSSMRPE
ncbi:MAG: hypothetical protein FD126_1914 [Elusimicrobia bacterium]|nr:MAG: hypothetical protein FD126_1914 [Elusimicrobiota bacterium]